MPSASRIAPNRAAIHPFDRKFGTDTGGYLPPEDLVTGHAHDVLNYGYSAIAPSVFREAFRRWMETLPAVSGRIEAYSFVDVGAGKGRAILLAAEQPFRKVIGVELNPDLASIARRNVGLSYERSKARIRVVQEDAANFRWPRGPLLVYFYNPFDCSLIEQLAESLAAAGRSNRGPVDLLYVNPTCAHVLTAKSLFKHLWSTKILMDHADQKADPYGTDSDMVSAFRLR
ncbi:MAG TPA: class I SAM-dependent methyltransferase [Candidatus Acidoferrales bacterium]